LLRQLYGSDQVDDHMLVLFWLEYLNSLSVKEKAIARSESALWKSILDHFGKEESRYTIVERQVEPFVLPALKGAGTTKANIDVKL